VRAAPAATLHFATSLPLSVGARVRTALELGFDPPRLVFQTDFIDTPGRSYDISADGQRLLVVKRAEPDIRDRIHVITNWTSRLTD
jgi:hypothetical protein